MFGVFDMRNMVEGCCFIFIVILLDYGFRVFGIVYIFCFIVKMLLYFSFVLLNLVSIVLVLFCFVMNLIFVFCCMMLR